MSHNRNMKWLNDRRIRYRQDPINDKPTEPLCTATMRMVHMNVITCFVAKQRLQLIDL